jgi:hypothetical protein
MKNMKKNPQAYLTIRAALAVNDPHAVIIIRIRKRRWMALSTSGDWRTTSATRKDAVRWGRCSQADIIRTLTTDVRAYCGRTGKRLA